MRELTRKASNWPMRAKKLSWPLTVLAILGLLGIASYSLWYALFNGTP